MTILPYPFPNEALPNASSRFTKKVIELADGTFQQVFGAQEVKRPVKEFVYNTDTNEGSFQLVDNQNSRKETIRPYIPNQDLIDLVRLGQILQRPILIKGEPGCGKTQLAKAIAFEWYGENYRDHFFEWHIKSTTKAIDGLYQFDHLKRLREAHIKREETSEEDLRTYRKFGPLAKAFLTSKPDAPSIILIDEIDKADMDFPNDLLLELDENRFIIPETEELIFANYPPLVFITSNDEREMPEAFLRRCLFMFLKFPKTDLLKNIIGAHLPGLLKEHEDFVTHAIKRFKDLKDDIENDVADNKRVSTSELLDWLKAYQIDLEQGVVKPAHLMEADLSNLPFYYQALLKTYEGLRREKKI